MLSGQYGGLEKTNETESMALRPEATVHGRHNLGVIKWILIIMIKSSWISSPELSFVEAV